MNTIKYFLYTLTLLFLPFSSYSQFDLEKNENILHQYSFGSDFEVFKNIKKNTYFITNEDEMILIKKLKYCENLNGSYLQALDKKNRIIYFNEKIEKIERPKLINYMVCGTVTNYNVELIKEGSNYFVAKFTDNHIIGEESTNEIVMSFPDNDYKKLYFINGKNNLKFDENRLYPTILIFEKKSKFGVIDNTKIFLYDSVEIKDIYLKVQSNGLWNYYNISKNVKYSVLGDFKDNLAYFELSNGKSGYLDKNGNEYYR